MWTAVRLNALTYPPNPVEAEELAQAGARLVSVEGRSAEEIVAAAENCDALLVVSARVPEQVIARLRKCRVISRLGAGTDRIDVSAATQAGVVVANVPDFCTHEQAEHTLALLLAFARRLPWMSAALRAGEFTARSDPQVHRLAGQTLGLLGCGQSAQAVAERARALRLRVVAWTRAPERYSAVAARLGIELLPLEELLAQSDYVSLHLPLTDETRNLLDARRLALLQPTAVLINTARGALVDEAALIEALRSGRLRGAALDTFAELDVFAPPGPPPEHPLLELDNVILTPHCAGSSVESTLDSQRRGAGHAAQVLSGCWPEHVVNRDVQPRWPLRKLGEP